MKAIGIIEVLAAVGLILPAALNVAPVLVPLAALGLMIVMVGASMPASAAASRRSAPAASRAISGLGPVFPVYATALARH